MRSITLHRILQKALAVRDKAASSRYDDVVERVMKYIDENYADEELSLNLLASHVNFSPNHLSMIFSQQTGTELYQISDRLSYEQGKGTLALHRQAQQPDQPGGRATRTHTISPICSRRPRE